MDFGRETRLVRVAISGGKEIIREELKGPFSFETLKRLPAQVAFPKRFNRLTGTINDDKVLVSGNSLQGWGGNLFNVIALITNRILRCLKSAPGKGILFARKWEFEFSILHRCRLVF